MSFNLVLIYSGLVTKNFLDVVNLLIILLFPLKNLYKILKPIYININPTIFLIILINILFY